MNTTCILQPQTSWIYNRERLAPVVSIRHSANLSLADLTNYAIHFRQAANLFSPIVTSRCSIVHVIPDTPTLICDEFSFPYSVTWRSDKASKEIGRVSSLCLILAWKFAHSGFIDAEGAMCRRSNALEDSRALNVAKQAFQMNAFT